MANRYRAVPNFSQFPAGDGKILVHSSLTRRATVLQASDLQLVIGCSKSFASLDEHTRDICQALRIDSGLAPAIRQRLTGLVEAGLIVSQEYLLERCQAGFVDQSVPGIEYMGIPTRNRPDMLRRSAGSFAECAQQFDRTVEFVVADGSDDHKICQENRQILSGLRKKYGKSITISYIGRKEKSDYARILSKQAGVAPEIVEFALLNPENCPIDTGSNRNAFLLDGAGTLSIQADDDMICRMLPAPETQTGLALVSGINPREMWFLGDDDSQIAQVISAPTSPDIDFFALHEQLLGKSVSSCLQENDAQSVDLSRAFSTFLERLVPDGGKVAVTSLGVAGDSGLSGSIAFLSLEGEERARLLASQADYRRAISRHKIIQAVKRVTIADTAWCSAGNLGFDGRSLIPPFMPVQRNEDGIFGAMLMASKQFGFCGFLPWALVHDAAEKRTFPHHHLWTTSNHFTVGEWIHGIVGSYQPQANDSSSRTLALMGKIVANVGSLPSRDFQENLNRSFWIGVQQSIATQKQQLLAHGNRPDYWSFDVQSRILWMQEMMMKTDHLVPKDLEPAFGAEQACLILQRLVLRFGELLEAWPQLYQAATQLRQRGQRLGTAVF